MQCGGTEGKHRAVTVNLDLVSIDFAQIEHPFIYNSFVSQNNQTGRVMTDRQAGVRQGIFLSFFDRALLKSGMKILI